MASTNPRQPDENRPLLNQRSAMIFLLAALAGLGAGLLAHLAANPWPVAVTAGAATTAAGVLFFNRIIE
ncbi:hypothetical protein ACIQ7Q_24415 [Streptomyces sp. NPDC096176]|uniref:hypothetical protein n=1 Tax=Streptomyces sp. NPDC096176 TaxID=3366079 RepID=UPI00380D5188